MAMTPYEQARQQASQLEYELSQQLYFERHSRQKRGPPSPVVSQATTPQEVSFTGSAARATDTAASSESFVQPVLLNETLVVQTVAAEFGVDVNDQQALERWMATPIKTNRDVLELVRAHHVKVARPEAMMMMMMIAQLEQALKKVGDKVFHTQQELHFMASDNRQQQKNAAGLMLISASLCSDGFYRTHLRLCNGWSTEGFWMPRPTTPHSLLSSGSTSFSKIQLQSPRVDRANGFRL